MSDEHIDAGCEEAVRAIREADAEGDNRTAYRLVDDAVLQYPDSAKLWALRTVSLLWRGRHDEALVALDRARELDPSHPWTLTANADVAVFEGGADIGRQLAEQALALDDTDPWLLQRLPSVYLVAKEHDKAVWLGNRWCELCPDSAEAFAMGIVVLHATGRHKDREALLEDAERRFPDSPRIWHARARHLMASQRLGEATELLQKAVAVQPGNWMMWSELASALSFAKRTDEAAAAAEIALEMSSCATIAMQAMARVCKQRGKNREAAQWQKRAASAIPAMRAAAALAQGNEANRKGDWKRAVAVIDEALPDMMPISRGVANEIKLRALLKLKRIDESELIVAEMEKLGRISTSYYGLRAAVREARGDLDAAISILAEGLDRYPDAGDLRAQLIRHYHSTGRVEAEAEAVEGSSADVPQVPWGIVELVMALDDTGHTFESREMRRIGLERFPNAEELSIFAAIDRIAVGDLEGAQSIARQVKGEWRHVAGKLDRSVSRLQRFRLMIRTLFGRRNDDKPPTLH